MRKKTWALGERGSGTILALGLIAMLTLLFALLQLPLAEVVSKARAQVIADQSALAAADALRGLAAGIPCEVAALVVAQSQAKLATCRVVGISVYVSVRINPSIVAEARAGI